MPATITENARQVLEARYLDGETVEAMFDRVSAGNKDYRQIMADLLFLPNSPTLFNMGRPTGGTLSACFVFSVDDTLLGDWPDGGCDQPFANSILGTNFKAAAVAKAGGGVGYYLGNLRPKGSPVHSTHRKACGPVTVLKYFHFLRSLITQGGRRDLAQMGVLPCWHKDVLEFIHCKDEDPRAIESFNISVSWTDEWLKKVDFESVGSEMVENLPEGSATRVWWEQCHSAWKTGDPGVLFYDTINRFHPTPHLGNIYATNPCGETPNINNEPCNLGSLALLRFVKAVKDGWVVDWEKLRHYVRVAIRFLDDILDWNVFPHPDITKAAKATRKLGLGVMGWADMLALLRIPYDSSEAVGLAGEVMKTINDTASMESIMLGESKGVYPAYDEAPEEVQNRFPRCRNSTRTSIAPTGTISILAGCEPGIEPHYALERMRTTNEGLKLTEKILDWLPNLGQFVPKVSNEIGWEWHIRMQAAFQKHTNLGVSKTINMPNDTTPTVISQAYRMMHTSGCKGGTVFRDGCRSEQVLVAKKKSVYSTNGEVPAGTHRKMPKTRTGPTHEFQVEGTKVYFTVNVFEEDGMPGEIFVRASKGGSSVNGMLDTWAMSFSKALQYGTPLEALVKLHSGTRFSPCGPTGDPDVPICSSVPDFIVRWIEIYFRKDKPLPSIHKTFTDMMNRYGVNKEVRASGSMKSGNLCPDCGAELILREGCECCPAAGCGFNRCG